MDTIYRVFVNYIYGEKYSMNLQLHVLITSTKLCIPRIRMVSYNIPCQYSHIPLLCLRFQSLLVGAVLLIILIFLVMLFCFICLRLVSMLPVSLDCPFLIATSVFSNVYFHLIKVVLVVPMLSLPNRDTMHYCIKD